MINIFPICALIDNYIWCLHNGKYAVIVDPGEYKPVLGKLTEKKLTLTAILVTHHHYDHTNGIPKLLEHFDIPVIGPKEIALVTNPVQTGTRIYLPFLDLSMAYYSIPGHTLEHVAYHSPGFIFTGDTLFTGGCGRIFEGTAQQMYDSLYRLKALPDNTLIYCGHEYTENNLKFALKVEPLNKDIQDRLAQTAALRKQLQPTVPASLLKEKQTNPFLRCSQPEVVQAASTHCGEPLVDPVQVLSVLREWKNSF
jgi:hydroxyacylglutathione hydrolase